MRLFRLYLLARGTHNLTSLLKPGLHLGVEVRLHNWLCWDSFLEGQLSILWAKHRAHHIKQVNLKCLANFWARGLMRRPLQTTHAQWIYRNSTNHLAIKEGQTTVAHVTILGIMEGFLHTDPEQLLEEHHDLLFLDFVVLASGPNKDKLE